MWTPEGELEKAGGKTEWSKKGKCHRQSEVAPAVYELSRNMR